MILLVINSSVNRSIRRGVKRWAIFIFIWQQPAAALCRLLHLWLKKPDDEIQMNEWPENDLEKMKI